MNDRRFTRSILVCLAALGLTVGCAGGDKKSDEATTEQSIDDSEQAEAHEDAKVLVEQASSWLPSDSVIVGGMTSERYWELSSTFFPQARVDIEGEEPGTPAGMRADLGELMLNRVGADLTALEGMAYGATQDSIGIVLFGDIPLDEQKLEAEDVDGHTIMSMNPGESTDVAPGDQTLWMTAFEEPRVGLAIFLKREHLVHALKSRGDTDGDEPPALLDKPIFEDLPTGGFVVVGHLDDSIKRQLGAMPLPPPDRLALSFGNTLTLHVEGSNQSLDGLSSLVDQYRSMASSQLDMLHQQSDSSDVQRATASIMGYHYGLAYLESFEESRADGRLTYSVSMPDTRNGFVVPGIAAAIAIPAFIKYIKRSKSSEAKAITRRLADGARAYFHSDQTGCKGMSECRSPWHSSVQAGMPVEFDAMTFPGGTDYRFVSHPKPPTDGKKMPARPETTNGSADVRAVLDALNISFDDPSYFRYIYETGPGTGADAYAKITAEADFDGNGEPNHRVEVELRVDPDDNSVRVSPLITLNEFE